MTEMAGRGAGNFDAVESDACARANDTAGVEDGAPARRKAGSVTDPESPISALRRDKALRRQNAPHQRAAATPGQTADRDENAAGWEISARPGKPARARRPRKQQNPGQSKIGIETDEASQRGAMQKISDRAEVVQAEDAVRAKDAARARRAARAGRRASAGRADGTAGGIGDASQRTRRPKAVRKSKRDRTLADLLAYPKTRRLLAYWVPFVAVVLPLGIWQSGSLWEVPLGILFGVFVYSLIEYASHRFLYHHEPDSRFVRVVTGDVARQHMRHHSEPGKYSGAINGNQLPVVVVGTLFVGLAFVLPLPLGFSLIAVAAGGVNYAAQELIHFGTHFLPMEGRILGAVKRHHMLHHYRDERANFGLFWTIWDAPFGTDFATRHKLANGGPGDAPDIRAASVSPLGGSVAAAATSRSPTSRTVPAGAR